MARDCLWFNLGDEQLDELVALVAERLRPEPETHEPWLGAAEAASYLSCSRQRIYDLVHARNVSGIPFRKEGSRLLFRRSELDRWLTEGASRSVVPPAG